MLLEEGKKPFSGKVLFPLLKLHPFFPNLFAALWFLITKIKMPSFEWNRRIYHHILVTESKKCGFLSVISDWSFLQRFCFLYRSENIYYWGNFKSLQKCLKILAEIWKWSVFGGYSLSSHAQTTISISSAISIQPNFAGLLKLPLLFYLILWWHFDFCVAKIGMPQKGLKKDDGVRGRREQLSSKVFPFFPDHKSTFIGDRAIFFMSFFS